MKKIPEVGDTITLKKFCYDNKAGGTAMSNWKYDEKYSDPIIVTVTKEWNDYECGQRGWAIPIIHSLHNKKLMEYLERNCKKQSNQYFRIYWSEFDIINVK